MFTGSDVAHTLLSLEFTHVVWLPDSAMGPWETALEHAEAAGLQLVRVCREGEAWPLAAGLHLGGKNPIVIVQSTGFFESGDAMRNVLFDLQLPLYAIVGYRNYLVAQSPDTARRFVEPILRAWELDYALVDGDNGLTQLADHCRSCRQARRPGIALLAEGKG